MGPLFRAKFHPIGATVRVWDPKTEDRNKVEETTGQKYNVRICDAGRP